MPANTPNTDELTPRMIVQALDRHIVGQNDAKKMVAIAMRNRTRRQKLDDEMREEISPKNIILIGPTGVGKTEIARRLARLAHAPFVKVEASKYTEVGYVGRDVESMVRDLVETSVKLVREEAIVGVGNEAEKRARRKLIDLLVSLKSGAPKRKIVVGDSAGPAPVIEEPEQLDREQITRKLDRGEYEDTEVEIEVTSKPGMDGMVGMMGIDESMMENMREMMSRIMPQRSQRTKMRVAEARKILVDAEIDELLDMEKIKRDALERAEQSGIIFIDEIDKIAGRENASGPDVSRQGVQRDILPIVEGCTVNTKYGLVRTDHVLFVAAGAFHIAKPSDLIPELQGRFPLRAELQSLNAADFERILTEPETSLIDQYKALLGADAVQLDITADAIEEIAACSATINQETEDIGARRLHTVLERVLEEVSFDAPDAARGEFTIDRQYVQNRLQELMKDQDLSKFIL